VEADVSSFCDFVSGDFVIENHTSQIAKSKIDLGAVGSAVKFLTLTVELS
jgi:hypothetical protein